MLSTDSHKKEINLRQPEKNNYSDSEIVADKRTVPE